MITIVEGHNATDHQDLVSAMFRQRARVFGPRGLDWDVIVDERGEERDKFDDLKPIYVIAHMGRIAAERDRRHFVKGSLRLLPTTGPTLFEQCFSDTAPSGISSPTIWECSRLCSGVLPTTIQLLLAIGEIAPRAEIESIIGNMDEGVLRLYRRIGLEVDVLGYTDRYGTRVYLGLFPIEPSIAKAMAYQEKVTASEDSYGRRPS